MKQLALTPLVVIILLTASLVIAQWSSDDSSMRKGIADRIVRTHGVTLDWRNNSLTTLIDAESRLNTAQRIHRTHGLLFGFFRDFRVIFR